MREIHKGAEAERLTDFKRKNPSANYADLSGMNREDIRQDIRQACSKEQFYLCAYCCQRISGSNDDTVNEHVEAQNLAPKRTLDFSNLVASCTTKGQCDAAHGSQPLTLTPLMPECETELKFKPLSGRVEGLTERAREAIRVLNLGDSEANNQGLVEKRKQLVDALCWKSGVSPDRSALETDQEFLKMVTTQPPL